MIRKYKKTSLAFIGLLIIALSSKHTHTMNPLFAYGEPQFVAATDLLFAAENGDIALVQTLIYFGVNVNYQDYQGKSALMYATFNNDIEMVELLLDAGAIDMGDNWGRTAYMHAWHAGYDDIMQLLIGARTS